MAVPVKTRKPILWRWWLTLKLIVTKSFTGRSGRLTFPEFVLRRNSHTATPFSYTRHWTDFFGLAAADGFWLDEFFCKEWTRTFYRKNPANFEVFGTSAQKFGSKIYQIWGKTIYKSISINSCSTHWHLKTRHSDWLFDHEGVHWLLSWTVSTTFQGKAKLDPFKFADIEFWTVIMLARIKCKPKMLATSLALAPSRERSIMSSNFRN